MTVTPQCLILFLMVDFMYRSIGDVNIAKDGVPWMCNIDPFNNQIIESLPINDIKLINKLEQVQAFHRHGSRVGSAPISAFLPNANLEYNCNITSLESRNYKDNDYYTNSSKSMFNLRKIYVANEQEIEGNCQKEQSLKYLILQQQANAQHIRQAYIGSNSYNLFNESTLNDIGNNIISNSEDERIKLTSTDFERTIASLTVITSKLLFPNGGGDNAIININTHDIDSDPYLCYYDDCMDSDEFPAWLNMYHSDPLTKKNNEILETEYANSTITAFENEGGIWSGNAHSQILYPYCNGMTLPLSNSTFWDAVRLGYEIDTAFVNTTYGRNKSECVYNFWATPLLNKIKFDINMIKQYSYPKLVIHSAHDWTILLLIHALGIYDYTLPIFGELLTLELYSSKNNTNSYYFRFTRRGSFVPFPDCDYQNGETQLCDLDIMLNKSFNNIPTTDQYLNQCTMVQTNCVCGYCDKSDNTNDNIETTMMYTTNHDEIKETENPCDGLLESEIKHEEHTIDAEAITFWIGIGIGTGIGMILVCIGSIIRRIFGCNKGRQGIHEKYLLEDEQYKL